MRNEQDIHVQLTDEGLEIAVLEVLRQHQVRKLLNLHQGFKKKVNAATSHKTVARAPQKN